MTPAPVAVTIGEPSGIGPEIIVKSVEAIGLAVPFFAVGDAGFLTQIAAGRGVGVRTIQSPDEVSPAEHLWVLDHPFPTRPVAGQPNDANAKCVIEAIARAVELAQSGAASAICTASINKAALKSGAEFAFPGHTEYLADLTATAQPVMMLASGAFRVVPVTIHIPLADVPTALTAELIESTIRIVDRELKHRFKISRPRLSVAGLNPHAGEAGHMGREEIDLIVPVLNKLRLDGLDISGPLPADTMFHAEARANYDAAICMYHDQALIPLKTVGFHDGVNVTLGLPIIRTSPDHGTALEIAGKNLANPSSMIEAIRMAWHMAGGS